MSQTGPWPHSSFLLSPLPKWERAKKLLLFTPHLPPKLLNFIPRTKKSIFIAAGGAGSGLLFYVFIFQSPVKSAPISWAAPRPQHARVSYGVSFSTTVAGGAGSRWPCPWLSGDPPFTCKECGEASRQPLVYLAFYSFPDTSRTFPPEAQPRHFTGDETQAQKGSGACPRPGEP